MARKCRICGDKFKPKFSTIQATCEKIECILEYGRLQAAKKKAKEHKKQKKDFYLNDVPYQLKLTQPVYNKMRVKEELLWFNQRGLEPWCISCGKRHMDWCCGHLKTVGAQSNLRFDEKNTFLQCNRYCNMGLSGNIEGNKNSHGFKQGLINRFGEDEGKSIIDYCESNTAPVKWSGTELAEMRKEFAAKTGDLEKQLSND